MSASVVPQPTHRGAGRPSRRRFALYSHDTQGLGHIRRNLAIAAALGVGDPPPDILIISGVREARAFPLPPHTDCVTLPALSKDASGTYGARALSTSLDDLIELRARTISAVLDAFAPDVLVVDKVARGQFGELELALEAARSRHGARLVLGLRDILDDPATTRREWRADATTEAITELYDAVWVYGDPRVFDPVAEYGLDDAVARLVSYTGYLAPTARDPLPGHAGVAGLLDRPYALCLVGGGQDGAAVASAFLAADLPPGWAGLVVAGPYMSGFDRDRLAALAATRPDRHVLDFVESCVPLLRRAGAVVAMGGYNTSVELLTELAPALVVPRVRPRREQLLRAERLARMGLIDLLHPDRLSAGALGAWLARAPAAHPRRPAVLDLGGLARLPALVEQLVDPSGQMAREVARVAS